MYLGRFQRGTWVTIWLQCVNTSGAPAMPDTVPTIRVWQGSTVLVNKEIPVEDKSVQTGLFRYPLFLGESFSDTGTIQVQLFYVRSGDGVTSNRTIEVAPGGNPAGQVLSMAYVHQPHANYIVYQTEDGRIRFGKNPRVG